MNLLIVNDNHIVTYYFNERDSQEIINRCQAAEKQWSNNLVGFFINTTNGVNYVAINIKNQDGTVESMEYVDIDTSKPEFIANDDFLSRLASRNIESEISLAEFDSLLKEILTSPVKARRWEVYQEINHHYQVAH